jgi:hypothetical protein
MVRNTYKVPVSQWRKWGERGRVTFNWLYGLMMNDPALFNHPKAVKQKPAHWKTVAWNAAWLAADAVKDAVKDATQDDKKRAA